MSSDAEILRLRDEIIGLRAQLDEAASRTTAAQADRDEAVGALDSVRDALDEVKVDLLQVTRERNALVELRVENGKLARHIHEMHQSWTWRIGRKVLLPIRIVRKLKRILTRR